MDEVVEDCEYRVNVERLDVDLCLVVKLPHDFPNQKPGIRVGEAITIIED